ncbi:hypothetical protein LJR225_004537 [Phenylobacterium sp. LjRoot225]|uniref:hypothetical protein n=1 Tax=Phenylobacterium sp. LjRoot225 TaxID=3342285 RepID=UPI003ECFB768
MTEPTTVSTQADDQAPARAAETARVLIERQLWVLGRLAEAGLNVALAIERQAMAAADEGPETVRPETFQVVQGDLALAYGRASRAVRLTLALQARLIKDLQALDEGEARHQAKERSERQQREDARKARVERIVERVIKAEFTSEDEITGWRRRPASASTTTASTATCWRGRSARSSPGSAGTWAWRRTGAGWPRRPGRRRRSTAAWRRRR